METNRKYEKYKVTKMFWATSIPQRWNEVKIKHLFNERSEKGFPDEPLLSATQSRGVIPTSSYENRTVIATKGFDTLKLVEVGDFVISLRSFQGGIEYAYYRGIISPAYTIITPSNLIYKGYFKYLAKSDSFIDLLKTCVTGIREGQNINYSMLKKAYIPVPSLEEQYQIERFLDSKISKINKFIKAKKREIELLKEQKQAEINRAVTKGINPKVPLKDSGFEWLGDIPEHWEIKHLRNFLFTISIKNRPEMPLLSVVREKGIIIRDIESKEENHNYIPDDLIGYKLVTNGQFVINKMKAWQGSYGVSEYDGIVSPAYYVYDLDIANKTFFHTAIRSKVYVNFFAQFSDGIRIGQWDLSPQKLKMIPFFLPPESEQDEILEFIEKKVKSLDEYSKRVLKVIEIVMEYKYSLIRNVVTGMLDVRGIKIEDNYEVDGLESVFDEIEVEQPIDEQ